MTAHLTFRTGRIIGEQLLDGSGESVDVVDALAFSEEVGTTLILREPIGVVASTRAKPSPNANGTIHGLGGAAFSADPEHALAVARRPRTGQVSVNGGAMNLSAPFGGYKQSGNGRELGRYGIEEFTEFKSINR